jgi:hypothetical protein
MATGVLNLGISGLEDYIMHRINRYIAHYSWLLPLLHQPWWWPKPKLKRPASRSESTIGTTVITTTGTITKTAPTGVTWWNSTGVIVPTTGSTTKCSGITGTGATVMRTAINEGRLKSRLSKCESVQNGTDCPSSL